MANFQSEVPKNRSSQGRAAAGGAPTTLDYLYKTKLCRLWEQGRCTRRVCRYAHGEAELREALTFERTRMCPAMRAGGSCADMNCRYAHSVCELRQPTPAFGATPSVQVAVGDHPREPSYEENAQADGDAFCQQASMRKMDSCDADGGDWGDGASMWTRSTTAASALTSPCSDVGFDADFEDGKFWTPAACAALPAPPVPAPGFFAHGMLRPVAAPLPDGPLQYPLAAPSAQAPGGSPMAFTPTNNYNVAAGGSEWPAAMMRQILREQCVRVLEAAMPDHYED